MEKKNYANQIRNKVSNFIEDQLMIGNTLEQSIQNYIMSFYQLDKRYSNQNYILKILILGIGYLDAYKIYSYKQKEGLTDDKAEEFLARLIDLEDIDDLIAEASADPEFLFRLIASMNEFNGLDDLEKIMLCQSLSADEHDMIYEMNPLHNEDIDNYGIVINLETLINAYIRKKCHQTFVGGINFDESIMMNLCGFVKNLLKLDYQNAQKLICEIATLDYSGLRVLNNNGVKVGYVEERIDLYENNNVETIFNTLISDDDLLKCSIYVALMVKLNGSIDNIALTENLLNSKESKRIRNKLNFGDNNNDE